MSFSLTSLEKDNLWCVHEGLVKAEKLASNDSHTLENFHMQVFNSPPRIASAVQATMKLSPCLHLRLKHETATWN